MASNLQQLVRKKRAEKRMKLGDLARRMGYKNIPKCCNKIQLFEEGRDQVTDAFLEKLAVALAISGDELWDAIEADLTEQLKYRHEHAAYLRAQRMSYFNATRRRTRPYRVVGTE